MYALTPLMMKCQCGHNTVAVSYVWDLQQHNES